MIFPFAGSRVPTGYLLCDGSEILIVQYQDLFNIIGYVYSDNLLGKNTFKVPDLRGRSIFGLDNMNNNITVPSIAPPYHNITTVGARANRLENGDDLGNNGGIEELTLGIDNLPEHEHTLKSRSGVQFFAHRNISSQIIDENVLSSNGMNMTNTGQYISSSGGVLYDTSIGQPVGIMPPYLCMNYIIFSG
jgi:microcystin-dependent protein